MHRRITVFVSTNLKKGACLRKGIKIQYNWNIRRIVECVWPCLLWAGHIRRITVFVTRVLKKGACLRKGIKIQYNWNIRYICRRELLFGVQQALLPQSTRRDKNTIEREHLTHRYLHRNNCKHIWRLTGFTTLNKKGAYLRKVIQIHSTHRKNMQRYPSIHR